MGKGKPAKKHSDYFTQFRKFQDVKMKGAAVFGLLAFGIALIGLIPKFGQLPSWFQKAPCVFQEALESFALLVSTADLVLELIKILPMIGVVALALKPRG